MTEVTIDIKKLVEFDNLTTFAKETIQNIIAPDTKLLTSYMTTIPTLSSWLRDLPTNNYSAEFETAIVDENHALHIYKGRITFNMRYTELPFVAFDMSGGKLVYEEVPAKVL